MSSLLFSHVDLHCITADLWELCKFVFFCGTHVVAGHGLNSSCNAFANNQNLLLAREDAVVSGRERRLKLKKPRRFGRLSAGSSLSQRGRIQIVK